jgi:8-hydroxy-5-deazaflavin:NADPH oxidoreductase
VSSTARALNKIAVIGGTGKEGGGLALHWAHAGYEVMIGSRSAEKAEQTAARLNALLGSAVMRGADNAEAARQADLVVVSVPYAAHRDTLVAIKDAVSGKIVVDVSVPIQPPHFSTVHLPPGRTAAEEAQALLGGTVRIVSAFQNVSATHLKDLDHPPDCDILITGDDADAKREVAALAEAAGMRGIDAGPLANAIVGESLTPLLVGINKRYGVKGSGIRITQIDPPDNHA